ncbi:MAG: efflux RND transporter periplasmic adaptor subunit [Rhizobiaceae bacterium]|nr:efflux RND transporter periplasmic adaptor subunit [Rhizobiaceae bacterium]
MPLGPYIRAIIFTLAMACAGASVSAAEFIVKPIIIDDLKAVFGSVASKNLQPARARIGGTLISISVEEGSIVIAGQTVAVVADDKLTLKLDAVDANISALAASHANALRELERGQSLFAKGLTSKARIDQLQTQADVLNNQVKASKAERFVIDQQIEEGKVLSPSSGRVLSVPQTRGAVVLPGEAIATIAGGGYFLRLALPERHAAFISEGDTVLVGKRGLSASPDKESRTGKVVKVYPKLENGRVIVDAEVANLDGFFIGERILVWIPVDKRRVLAVPPEAITTRSGIDYITITTASGESEIAVIPGQTIDTKDGPRTEILSGISFGDKVVLP